MQFKCKKPFIPSDYHSDTVLEYFYAENHASILGYFLLAFLCPHAYILMCVYFAGQSFVAQKNQLWLLNTFLLLLPLNKLYLYSCSSVEWFYHRLCLKLFWRMTNSLVATKRAVCVPHSLYIRLDRSTYALQIQWEHNHFSHDSLRQAG